MFDIGFGELAVLVLAALFVFGPDRLPVVTAQAVRALRQIRAMATGAREQLTEAIGPELEDLDVLKDLRDLNQLNALRKLDPRAMITSALMDEPGSTSTARNGKAAANGRPASDGCGRRGWSCGGDNACRVRLRRHLSRGQARRFDSARGVDVRWSEFVGGPRRDSSHMVRKPVRTTTIAAVLLGLAGAALLAPSLGGSASAAPAPAVVDRVLSDTHIVESSSLVKSAYTKNMLWTANDSGGGPVLFAIGANGSTLATYTVNNVSSKDWEGMAAASSGCTHYIYIGDIGDNGKKRPTIAVHRVVEPTPVKNGSSERDDVHVPLPRRAAQRRDADGQPVDAAHLHRDQGHRGRCHLRGAGVSCRPPPSTRWCASAPRR